jgi:hypothetical protein
MSIQFNWCEMISVSTLADAHVVLLFCLYANVYYPSNRRIASSHRMLQNKLHIGKNYYSLIASKFVIEHKNGLFSNFACTEPQSYLNNCSFVHSRVPAYLKSEYLHILSQRSINNTNNWIPEEYVEPKYWDNPFIERKQSKLIFTLEN